MKLKKNHFFYWLKKILWTQKVSYPPEVVFIEISSYYSSAPKCSETPTGDKSLPARRVSIMTYHFIFNFSNTPTLSPLWGRNGRLRVRTLNNFFRWKNYYQNFERVFLKNMFFKTVYTISRGIINESTWNLVHLF